MKNSTNLILIVLLLTAVFAAVSPNWFKQNSNKVATSSDLTSFVQAAEDIPAGTMIEAKSLRIMQNKSRIPQDALRKIDQGAGEISGGILEGQYLFKNRNSVTGIRHQDEYPMRTAVYMVKDVEKGRKINDDDLQECAIGSVSRIPQYDILYCRSEIIGKLAKYGLGKGQIVSTKDLSDFKGYPDPAYNHAFCSKAQVYAATKVLLPNHKINKDDFKLKSVNALEAPDGSFDLFTPIENKVTSQKVFAGQVFTRHLVK